MIDRGIGRRSLEPDHIDPDVVRVVHTVALDQEVLDIPVDDQRLGRTESEVRQLVVDDLNAFDGVVARRAEHTDPVRIPAVAAVEGRPHIVHEVAVESDVIRRARYEDAHRHVARYVAPVPRDLEPLDRDVALAVDRDHRGLSCRYLQRRAVDT